MITIYGKENCSFCDQAKKFLIIKDIEFEYIDLTKLTVQRISDILEDTKAKTVPIIFIDGEYIGGYNQLVDWFNDKG